MTGRGNLPWVDLKWMPSCAADFNGEISALSSIGGGVIGMRQQETSELPRIPGEP